jgi:hypothetical protein
LNLVVLDRPPLLGNIRVNTMFDLPPGNEDVVKRLQLNGTFGLAKAEFTSDTVQDKIEELSRKSRGIHEPRHERIVSQEHASIKDTEWIRGRDFFPQFTSASVFTFNKKITLEYRTGFAI